MSSDLVEALSGGGKMFGQVLRKRIEATHGPEFVAELVKGLKAAEKGTSGKLKSKLTAIVAEAPAAKGAGLLTAMNGGRTRKAREPAMPEAEVAFELAGGAKAAHKAGDRITTKNNRLGEYYNNKNGVLAFRLIPKDKPAAEPAPAPAPAPLALARKRKSKK
jgi:hypothetical protein